MNLALKYKDVSRQERLEREERSFQIVRLAKDMVSHTGMFWKLNSKAFTYLILLAQRTLRLMYCCITMGRRQESYHLSSIYYVSSAL